MIPRYERLFVSALLTNWTVVSPSGTEFSEPLPDGIRASTDGDQFAAMPAGKLPFVLNGSFASAANWTAGAGWEITGGAAVATATSKALTQTTATVRETSSAIVAGQKYLLTYTVGGTPSGTLTPSLGGTAGTGVTTTGVKQEVIAAGSTNADLVFTGTAFTGTVDDVSLVPLTPPLSARSWEVMRIRSLVAVVSSAGSIVTNSPAWIGWLDGKG